MDTTYFRHLQKDALSLGDDAKYFLDMNLLNKSLGALEVGRKIGEGANGVAYQLSNQQVLKITSLEHEAECAEKLIDNPNPYITRYHRVWENNDLFCIVRDYAPPMSPKLKTQIEKLEDRFICIQGIKEHINRLSNFGIEKEIKSYLEHLQKLGLGCYDLINSDNIGEVEGQIKVFDIS